MKSLFTILFSVCLIYACGDSTGANTTGCAMGVPKAMFSPKLQGFANHSFRVTQNNSTEEFSYKDNPVVVFQTGCDYIEQEFQFTFNEKTDTDEAGMVKLANILLDWSRLGKNYVSFKPWADQIRAVSTEMQMGTSFNPSPDIEILVNKINTATGEILTIAFKQKS